MRTKQGRGVIKEIRYITLLILYFLLMVNFPLPMDIHSNALKNFMLWAQFLSPKVVVVCTYLQFMTEARLIDLYYVCVNRAGATKTEDVVIHSLEEHTSLSHWYTSIAVVLETPASLYASVTAYCLHHQYSRTKLVWRDTRVLSKNVPSRSVEDFLHGVAVHRHL